MRGRSDAAYAPDLGIFRLDNRRDIHGMPLTPGVNVDRIDIASGLRLAEVFGFGTPKDAMVLTYALQRHARGEEAGAERTALAEGIDFTSWRAVLAAARAGGERAATPSVLDDTPHVPSSDTASVGRRPSRAPDRSAQRSEAQR